MSGEERGEERSIEVTSSELSVPQLERIVNHFGRHANLLTEAAPYHDLRTRELRFIAKPSEGVSDEVAVISLARAVEAARFMHPSDNLDMSA